jgi:hypothetical protein
VRACVCVCWFVFQRAFASEHERVSVSLRVLPCNCERGCVPVSACVYAWVSACACTIIREGTTTRCSPIPGYRCWVVGSKYLARTPPPLSSWSCEVNFATNTFTIRRFRSFAYVRACSHRHAMRPTLIDSRKEPTRRTRRGGTTFVRPVHPFLSLSLAGCLAAAMAHKYRYQQLKQNDDPMSFDSIFTYTRPASKPYYTYAQPQDEGPVRETVDGQFYHEVNSEGIEVSCSLISRSFPTLPAPSVFKG